MEVRKKILIKAAFRFLAATLLLFALGLFSAIFALAPLVTAEDPVVTHQDGLSGLVLDATVSEILRSVSDWFATA